VILTTYEATFAASWGKKVRNILNSNSDELGMSIAQDSAAAAYWHTTVGGGMMTAGVGGPITGKGGRLCAAKGTIVVTNAGFIEISQLSACYKGLLALSYDHESDALVWRKIHAFMESEYHGELVEIETAGGNKIRLTPEHPIYDRERGYREAGSFLPGDRVYTVALPVEQDLPNMREAEGGARDGMQSVLSEGEKGDNCSQLYLMWQGFREAALRIRKSIEARVGGFLLRCGVQPESSCRQKQSSLPRLRQKFCSLGCRAKITGDRVCTECGRTFAPKMTRIKYCSAECRRAYIARRQPQFTIREYREIRELIFGRDGGACAVCGKTRNDSRVRLNMHHIDDQPKNNTPENLVTLCASCHSTITNSERTRWQWLEGYAMGRTQSMTSKWKELITSWAQDCSLKIAL
jgi:hypothetical protein